MAQKTKTPQRKNRYFLQGYVVAFALAVLTGIEYVVAVSTWSSAILLFLLAILKAALVLNYFMHISSLWKTEEGH